MIGSYLTDPSQRASVHLWL